MVLTVLLLRCPSHTAEFERVATVENKTQTLVVDDVQIWVIEGARGCGCVGVWGVW